jgi:ABC-type transport system involved in multi-copper enzyme maturation permease subunit
MDVFWYDLIRTTRRGHTAALRTAYVVVLFVALGGAFVARFPGSLAANRLFVPIADNHNLAAAFAVDFVTICLIVQFAAAIILTPVYAAGAIAEERQNGTLDSVLVTDISPWAIVFGRFASRWLTVASLLITSLPILALTQLWGGVSWEFLTFGASLTLLTTFSVAGIGVFCSVGAKSVRAAIAATYVFAAALDGFAAIFIIPIFDPKSAWFASTWLGYGNRNGSAGSTWLIILAGVAIWHVAVCLIALVSAVWLLRPHRYSKSELDLLKRIRRRRRGASRVRLVRTWRARVRAPVPTSWFRQPAIRRTRVLPIPAIGADPLLWRELYFGGPGTVGEMLRMIVYGLIGGGLTVGLTFSIFRLLGVLAVQRQDAIQTFNPVARDLALTGLTVIMVATALRAAGAIGRERDGHTLDNLLVLPGGRDAVLRAKWLGSFLSTRWIAIGLTAVLLLGILGGASSVATLFWLALAGAIHAAFTASMGLYISTKIADTARAMMVTLLCLATTWALPLLASAYWLGGFPGEARQWPWVKYLMQDGLIPFLTWRFLAAASIDPLPAWVTNDQLTGALLGLGIYAVGAWFLWRAALGNFRRYGGKRA